MPKKPVSTTPFGINQDEGKGRAKNSTAFHNQNIRITPTSDAQNLLSISNELGPLHLGDVPVHGTPRGHFVCGDLFGIFSFDDSTSHITVYRKLKTVTDHTRRSALGDYREALHYSSPALEFHRVPEADGIESVVSAESSKSLRVYWIDGLHQLRVIDVLRLIDANPKDADGIVRLTDRDYPVSYFSYLPKVKHVEDFSVTKMPKGNLYSGTIQFCVTEVENANESNIAHYSPLHYVSDDANNRGFATDNDTAGIGFSVTFTVPNPDKITSFNVYAIHRSSQNGAPTVYRQEVKTNQGETNFHTSFIGLEETVDPSRLIFKNSQLMTAVHGIAQKDNTLFLANYSQPDSDVLEPLHIQPATAVDLTTKVVQDGAFNGQSYSHTSQLSKDSFVIGHFKHGEQYALAYQLMDEYGHWGEPIFLGFHRMDKTPIRSGSKIGLPYFSASLENQIVDGRIQGHTAIRPVIAYLPDAKKRCLFQGFVTPTIFSQCERANGTCFAKLSPFTRTMRFFESYKPDSLQVNPNKIICSKSSHNYTDAEFKYLNSRPFFNKSLKNKAIWSFLGYDTAYVGNDDFRASQGTYPASQHLQALGTTKDYNCEIQTSWYTTDVVYRSEVVPFGGPSVVDADDANLLQASAFNFKVEIAYEDPNSFNLIDKTKTLSSDVPMYITEDGQVFFMGKQYSDASLLFADFHKKDADGTDTKALADLKRLLMYAFGAADANVTADYDLELAGETAIAEDKKISETFSPYASMYESFKDVLLKSYVSLILMKFDNSAQFVSYSDGTLKFQFTWNPQPGEQGPDAQINSLSEKTSTILNTYARGLGRNGFYVITSGTSSVEDDDDTVLNLYTLDNSKYYVDSSNLTFHSPDVTDATSLFSDDANISIVGAMTMNGFVADSYIDATTPNMAADTEHQGDTGFNHRLLSNTSDGRCAMTFPSWTASWNPNDKSGHTQCWASYPFGTNDFIALENNAGSLQERTTSKLNYKQLANYRYSSETIYYSDEEIERLSCKLRSVISESDYTVFDADRKVYKGSEDVVILPSSLYAWSNGYYYSFDKNSSFRNWLLDEGNLTFEKVNKIKLDNQACRLNMYACVEVSENAQDPMRYNLSTLMSVSTRGYYAKKREPSYKGFWKGSVKDLNQSWTNIIGKTRDCQEWYSDDLFNLVPSASSFTKYVLQDGKSNYQNDGKFDKDDVPSTVMVNMKYVGEPHIFVSLDKPIFNTNYLTDYITRHHDQYINPSRWNETNVTLNTFRSQGKLSKRLPNGYDGDALWIVDIVNNANPQISESTDANASTPFHIAGPAVWANSGKTTIEWLQGDWYYQRYECLRTHPYSVDDKNQVVEIVSGYVETRTNVDGRYDKNRGLPKLTASQLNWNLINDSYTQLPTYFTYYRTSLSSNVVTDFPFQVTWSLPKILNSPVDEWTSITGVNILDMDGDKEPIVKLTKFKNELYCIQPHGFSRILYNSRTQIQTSDGVPIEIANSAKVEGKIYLSNNNGARYKRNIVTTDNAIYYADKYNNDLCIFTEQTESLTEKLGLSSWLRKKEIDRMFLNYDNYNKSVFFTDNGIHGQCLSFSERMAIFDSFYDYEDTYDVINVQDDTILIHNDGERYGAYRINAGEYNVFFGKLKRYWTDMFVLPEYSSSDNVFDNLDFQGDLFEEPIDGELRPVRCPFNLIQVFNEYQDSTEVKLEFVKDWHQNVSNIKQKYRQWHVVIPRDQKEARRGHTPNRMRSPWLRTRLIFDPTIAEEGYDKLRMTTQDFTMNCLVVGSATSDSARLDSIKNILKS